MLRILFDKNVPVGVRRFLVNHEVRTVVEIELASATENGELLGDWSSACRLGVANRLIDTFTGEAFLAEALPANS